MVACVTWPRIGRLQKKAGQCRLCQKRWSAPVLRHEDGNAAPGNKRAGHPAEKAHHSAADIGQDRKTDAAAHDKHAGRGKKTRHNPDKNQTDCHPLTLRASLPFQFAT
jgi:hypothetical protein